MVVQSETDKEALRLLVTESLVDNGTLSRLRAELRSAVLSVLQSKSLTEARNFTEHESIFISIISDALQYLNLSQTASVLKEEASRAEFLDNEELGQILQLEDSSCILSQLLIQKTSNEPLVTPSVDHLEREVEDVSITEEQMKKELLELELVQEF